MREAEEQSSRPHLSHQLSTYNRSQSAGLNLLLHFVRNQEVIKNMIMVYILKSLTKMQRKNGNVKNIGFIISVKKGQPRGMIITRNFASKEVEYINFAIACSAKQSSLSVVIAHA